MSSGADVTCRCPPQATGPRCERILPCASPSLPCLNGGSCSPLTGLCLCPFNATGERCETTMPCGPPGSSGAVGSSNPCFNGAICLVVSAPLAPGGVGFRCVCPPTHTGALCEGVVAALCSPTMCVNGGTCREPTTAATSQVQAAWQGAAVLIYACHWPLSVVVCLF